MADKKLSALTAATAMATGDLIPFTATPGVTPASKNITRENFFKQLALGSDADGDMYYRASSLLARLPKGAANTKLFTNTSATAPEWAKGSATGEYSYDMATDSGTEAIVIGFRPALVFLQFSMTGAGGLGIIKEYCYVTVLNNALYGQVRAGFIHAEPTAGNRQVATLALTDTGATLTWTKTGSPTGTLYYQCAWIR